MTFSSSGEALEDLRGTKLVNDEAGSIDGDLGQMLGLGGPDRVVLEEFDKITLQRHGTGRAGGKDEIRIILEHRCDILLGQRNGGFLVPGVKSRHSATVLFKRIGDFDIQLVHDLDQVNAEFRVEEIIGATAEERDLVARFFDLLRNLLPTGRATVSRQSPAGCATRSVKRKTVADDESCDCRR